MKPQREGITGARALPFPWLRDDDNLVARKVGLAFELPRDLSWAYRELGIDLPKQIASSCRNTPFPPRCPECLQPAGVGVGSLV
jgi:hypothetical protein